MKVSIEFSCRNAAFDNSAEIGRVLRMATGRLEDAMICCGAPFASPLYDINGNKVGIARLEVDDEC